MGTRTPDLYSAIVALSQLSYAPSGRDSQYTDHAEQPSNGESGAKYGIRHFNGPEPGFRTGLNPYD